MSEEIAVAWLLTLLSSFDTWWIKFGFVAAMVGATICGIDGIFEGESPV